MVNLATIFNPTAAILDTPTRLPSPSRPSNARLAVVLLSLLVGLATTRSGADELPSVSVDAALRDRAVGVLRQVLDSNDDTARLRAADFLLRLDYPQGVAETLADHDALAAPDEAASLRVSAQAAPRPEDRTERVEQLRRLAADPDSPARDNAIAALARLGDVPPEPLSRQLRALAAGDDPKLSISAAWLLASTGEDEAFERLAHFLSEPDPRYRAVAARALRRLVELPEDVARRTVGAADAEPGDSPAADELAAAAAFAVEPESRGPWLEALEAYARSEDDDVRYTAVHALAGVGTRDQLPLMRQTLDDPDLSVRAAAAWAVLRLDRRTERRLFPIDWIVIGFYATGMVAIGWYYSRRTKSSDDYLLGGRTMRPLSVGLSLFATLLSTITYLAWPGEMIKNGPMMLCIYLGHPFTFVLVGYFMIPAIMKLRVTSAYEILEAQLGLSVRMLGSLLFLSLRLAWMAVIIYATTSKVLVPLVGLPVSATPYLCAVLGLITVIYTSMGGLRAVVLTDVIQSCILFGAAILTVVLVSVRMGGIGNWWPDQFAAHWAGFTLYDPAARVSLIGAAMAMFTWWVSTSGSDQMAIQRYLSTRDAKAARRVLLTTLIADCMTGTFLATLGLALLGYFSANPHFLPDSQRLLADADQLFPRFIALGLPAGISGLVVAGLLAAAMSSLSSGVNSSCSVITIDFIGRFRRRGQQTDAEVVRTAKWVSVFVGLVVVLLSAVVNQVSGNLLEVAYKVVNLLVSPLFGLFFMAMFVRWATSFGTLVGAAGGLSVVVAINYWEEITGTKGISFLWAMPLGFVVEVGIGSLVSLLPIGRKPKPLTTDHTNDQP